MEPSTNHFGVPHLWKPPSNTVQYCTMSFCLFFDSTLLSGDPLTLVLTSYPTYGILSDILLAVSHSLDYLKGTFKGNNEFFTNKYGGSCIFFPPIQ